MTAPEGIRVEGLAKLQRTLNTYEGNVSYAIMDAINRVTHVIFMESQQQVPFEEGTLQASGRQEYAAKQPGGNIVGAIHYGGSDSPAGAYAVNQHEREDVQNYTMPGTKRKYLEDPAEEHRGELITEVTAAIRRVSP